MATTVLTSMFSRTARLAARKEIDAFRSQKRECLQTLRNVAAAAAAGDGVARATQLRVSQRLARIEDML